jgi:hypothetical protein
MSVHGKMEADKRVTDSITERQGQSSDHQADVDVVEVDDLVLLYHLSMRSENR